MLHQLVFTLLLPILSTLSTVTGDPVVVTDPQPQELCYLLPARCDKDLEANSANSN
ncbi:hypothetical protein [Pseudoalteromonas tunicata]|jgi:hypothetical protein|uniref:Uncharacterized protein n=1 Tax=Pseudoalteromonas tunicata D2 TaxID=87626 RepID=A4CDR4_9GAMM|nr:hypothetical protein [Pseudoalteromonas tunicata]ATC96403.1 hypothetical protein PTUN_a4197 [Pseudoalteromonas tunicata]EAR27106.1 hypothetical protein PTD2_05530 [Pseudoalteromonas tunicata D2]